MHPRNLLIALVLGAALAAGVFMATRPDTPGQPQTALEAAFVLPSAMPLPEFSLLDQHGNAVTRSTFHGRWSLLFFGFSHCPDICPTTLQILAAATTELASARNEPPPRIVLVSVDPQRDTPLKIGKYVDYFAADILAITGKLEELTKLTSALGIFFARRALDDNGDGDDYTVDHTTAVLVINPGGDFHALFSGRHNTASFVHDLPLIMANYQPRLLAADVVVTEPLPGARVSAGFLSLANNTDEAISISAVGSPQFEVVEIHESLLEDGVARMRRITELVIPAHETVTLQRGGLHLMLLRPTQTGDTVSLRFFEGETLALVVDTRFARKEK